MKDYEQYKKLKYKEYEQYNMMDTKDEQIELTILKIEDCDVVSSRVITFEPENRTKFRKQVKERVFTETQLAELILEWT